MAVIMSMEEWDRKRKNKSVSIGSAALTSSVKDSSATESKRRVLPSLETWESSQSYDTSLRGFAKQADTTVRAIQKYYSEYHDDEDKWYESYDKSLSTLLSSADRWRREYADDADVVTSIDEIADTLTKTKTYIKEANKRNKQWKGTESYTKTMNRLAEADKINELYGMSTQEIEAAQLEAQGISTEELESLHAKKKSLEQKANAYSFSRGVTQEQKKAVQNELAQVNNAIQSAEQKSAIAYTTMDGQNITWDALYRRKKKEEDYASFSKREDWAENSTYKSTVPDENADYNDFSQPTVDWDYEEINNPEAFSHLRGGSTYRSEHMTKEEMEMFNYIYHTQGRDAAFDWQRGLAEDLETLRVQDIAAKTKEFASKSPLHGAAAWVGARLTSPLAGAEYVGDLVDNLFVPEKSMRNTAAARNAAVDSAITEQVDWNIGKWDAFDFGYGTLASAVDSALASLLPGGEAVLGLSAAAAATNAALDRGMDERRAIKAGISAGVFESVFEHLSIGKFKKLQMVDSKSPKDFVFNTIKSMGINASEEAATEIANSVYDIYVNGEFSDYETNVRMMVQNGMTPEEARAEAKKALRKQIAEAAASGALMGLGFGATGSAIGYNNGLKQTGKEARSADGFNLKGLANESLQLNPDNKLAQKVLDKGTASDRQVGKLVRSNEDARHAADVENTRQAVTARLTELKATENVEAVADAVTKYVTGEKLTKAEQELIRRNRVAPQVAQEIREQKRAEMYMRIVKAAQIETEGTAERGSIEKTGDFLNEGTKNATRKERAVSVVSLENGEMYVKRENGETVNAKSYRAVGSDQVYETIRNISSDVEEANTYVQAYAASPVSAETFEKGLRLAQMYGVKNFPIGELESTSAGKLPENIRTMAYDHAQQSVQAAEAFLTEIGMSSESIKSVFAESPMDGRVDLNDMANGICVAFLYGVVGIDKAKAPAGSDGLKLTDAQWNEAYRDGRAYARKRTDTVQTQNQTRKISKVKAVRNAKVVNGVKYHGVSVSKRAMNERQRPGIGIAELLASMGMDVHLHQSIMDLNGRYVFTDDAGVYRSDNGFYRKRDGSIHIDVNAGIDGEGLLVYTLSHELTHFIEDWSSEKFKLYADMLISELGKTEVDVDADLNRMINRIRNDPQYSELTKQEKQDIAYSELIAEYSETMLANTDVLKRIAEKIKTKDKSLAQKIHNFFAGIVKKLREAYKDYEPNSRLAQEAEQTIRSVDALAEAFADAVVDAADRFAKAEAVLNESGVAIDAETDTAILESPRYAPKNQEEIDATAIAFEKALAQNSDHKDGNLLSQRDPDGGYSNRSLLANALESTVQHEVEAKRLAEYKAGIAEMSKQQKKLSELTEEWRSLMFAKGTRSAETKARIEALREEIDKTAVRINDYDKKLLRLEAAAPLQKVLEREKAKALKKAKEKEKAALKDQRTDFNERVKKQKLRSSVEKNAKSLMNMMSHPTKDAHVPNSMLEPLNEFLESIDFVSKQQSEGGEATIRDITYTRALNGVRRAVEGQVSAMNGSDFAGEYTLDINADFIKKIDEHIKEIEDATKKLDTGTNRVYAMNSAELKQLSEILRTINKAIRDIDKLHMQGAKARVSDLAADTKQELSRRKPVKTDDGGKAMWANYTPWHAFRRMGKSAQQIFKGLMQGQAKLAQNVNAVIEFTKKTYSAKEVKKWESDIHTIELSSGENVKLTTAQLMSFYCLSQREHALDHLTGGGIRVVTIEDGLKKIRQPNKFLLSLEDISKINELLMKNERAFAVAKELQKYMSSVGSDLINEISMARWDYMAATEKDYFPTKTDETSRDVKDPGQDATNLWALLNKSFTKGLTEGANNAIYVESIFDVFADHMSEVSEYNAFALPLVDAMRWFNYRERNKLDGTQIEDSGVHDTIKTVLGSAAVDYFRNLMTDINSSQKAGRHENIAGQILSRSKISSVGYNLRVMIQQPTAILRASLILDPGSLLKGTARIRTKELVKEMQQYSGIALWKSMGYYDLNVSRSVKEQIKHDNSFIDKANDVGTWLPGKMDEVTWARIWAAAKAQVAKNQKLKGEALLKATAELFEEIVYQTQVADSVLTRSSLMRSKSQFMKEATSFMAESTVSLNILLSAFQDYEEGHKTWDKVKRGVMIGFAGYAMSSIVNACITALADAWRDDDEYEEFHEKYLQALFGEKSFFDGNLFAELNPLEKIVFVKDVFSVLKGYDVMPGYADLFKSGYDLVTNYQKFIEGRGTITLYGLIYNTLQVVGTVGGIGLSNIAREVVGVWNHTVGMIYPEMKLVRYDIERKNQIRSALEGGSLSDEEAMELLVEEGVAENEDEAYFTVEKWRSEDPQHYSKYNDLFEAAKAGKSIDKALKVLTDHGVKEKDAISTLKSKIGEWYTGTEDVPQSVNKQETINMLEKYTDMKESEITAQVNKWTAVVVTGIKYQDIEEKFISGEIKESRAIEMRAKYGGQTQKEAAAVVSKWKCEKDTGIPYDSLREEFVDGNITEKEAVNSMVKYGGIKQREAEGTVTGWKAEKETGVAYSSIRESFLEGELTESEAIDMYKNYGGMSQSEAEDAAAALQFEKDYGFSYSNKREAYIDGEISETTLRKALTEYGEKSAEDAENTIRAYDWMKQNPEYDLSEDQAVAYTKPLEEYGGYSVADTGLDPDIFISYKEQVGECEGVDSNGDGKADKNSKKKQILTLIDSLPISNTQKDALYFASGNWTASKLYEAPWR